jgi:hypothetical protein
MLYTDEYIGQNSGLRRKYSKAEPKQRMCLHVSHKKLNIKIYKTVILPVVLYGCETWSPTLREEESVEEDIWTSKEGRQIVDKNT